MRLGSGEVATGARTRWTAGFTGRRPFRLLSGATAGRLLRTALASRLALAGWLIVFTGYAAAVATVSAVAHENVWGVCAVAGYGVAAVAAWRWPGSAAPMLIGLSGAVIVPAVLIATHWPGSGETTVVTRAATLLLHHGNPYLSGHLRSAQAYNPYLPAMSLFGLPKAVGLPGVLGNPTAWMGAASAVLVAAAIGAGLPGGTWRRAPGRAIVLRNTALAVLSPVLALPITLGMTDPPVIALICLALACATRPAAGRPATGRPATAADGGVPPPGGAARRRITSTGLAALAIGSACAMKATAWPALLVIVALIAAREGRRAAARFTATAAAVAIVLIAGLAPALVSHPGAFVDNIIAYPLGLTHHLTPAASPLPGHLLASTGTAGHIAAIALLLLAAAALGVSFLLRPPRSIQAAAILLAVGFILLFTLAPATRFGYFAYPAALLGWLGLTGHWQWAGPGAEPPDGRPQGGSPGPVDGGAQPLRR
jgi:hypothetical protein